MAPNLIRATTITYTVNVPEYDIRSALMMEAAEKHGLTHEGKIIPGVSVDISYDGRRGSRNAGYKITLTRDPSKSEQALLPARGDK